MTKRPIVATLLTAAALVLLLSFKTPQVAGLGSAGGGGGTTGGGTTGGGTTGGGTGAAVATVKGSYSGTLTGSAVDVGYGTVQVQVTLQNGAITDVTTLQMPRGGHSGQVSSYAAPQLKSEALRAQSAQIDTISGATYTSEGYIQSLQSALSQAA
jgi:uncharacterized protein with FMN-binding domain